jgi:hypothetical protein
MATGNSRGLSQVDNICHKMCSWSRELFTEWSWSHWENELNAQAQFNIALDYGLSFGEFQFNCTLSNRKASLLVHKISQWYSPVVPAKATVTLGLMVLYFRLLMSRVYAPPAFAKSIKHSRSSNGSSETNLFIVLVCEQDSRGMACTLGIQAASFFVICHNLLNLDGSQSASPVLLYDQMSINIPFPHAFRPESARVRYLKNRKTVYYLPVYTRCHPFRWALLLWTSDLTFWTDQNAVDIGWGFSWCR